ncbi:MAG: ATP-binding cassette domain-containing protein [Candidatus Oleimmundimicrobium sp.]|nr:ATP-binding cassette domain-containing protein [Candidatus Oleimmundimicrobium sp.]
MLEGLTKRFNDLTAVDNVSFTVREGEVFGFLGPNGAGKTTTISMLATLLNPTSGKASVNGFNIWTQRDAVRKSIGIVFQDPSLDEELTAYENMDFHGRLYHIPRDTRIKKIEELLKLVELDERKNDLVKKFSGGMRRRLEIARGLMHEPKVLFLDEPTLGLDPQTRNHIWEYIQRLSTEKNVTIILTTHYMEEADRLCDRMAIIDKGKIIALDTPKNLKDGIGGDVITVETPSAEPLRLYVEEFPWYKSSKEHDGMLTINVTDAEKHIAEIVNLSCQNNIEIKSINVHKPTLEDVFLYFTGRTIREEEAGSVEHMRMMRRAEMRR